MPMYNPPHPGEILGEDVIKALGLSVTTVASRLGISRKVLSQIIHGHAPITAETAIKLERVFDRTDAGQWLRLQMAYDLFKARQKLAA